MPVSLCLQTQTGVGHFHFLIFHLLLTVPLRKVRVIISIWAASEGINFGLFAACRILAFLQ